MIIKDIVLKFEDQIKTIGGTIDKSTPFALVDSKIS